MRPEEAASAVLESKWDMSIPVNSIEIANKLGLKVFLSSDTGENSGYYNQRKQEITIREGEPTSRQRFSVAHELGHAVLGHGSSPRRTKPYTQSSYIRKEMEANIFAAELIMPRDAIKALVEVRGLGFEELCKKFDVSRKAMEIRLQQLGYI